MLKTCFAASILAMLALAVSAQAQTQQERDDKACAEQGAGPDTDGYSACIAQRKIDRFKQAQRRAADVSAMSQSSQGYRVQSGGTGLDPQTGGYAMKDGPLPNEMMYMMPKGTRALEGVQDPQEALSVTKTQVCVTQGDPAKPKDDAATPQVTADAAKPSGDVGQPASDVAKRDAANAQPICQTNVEVTKKVVSSPRADPRNDPHNPLTHSYMHPGDIFNDHQQF